MKLELLAADGQDETLDTVESIAIKITEILPHTPYGALGINFGFFDNEPPDHIEPLFATAEKLEDKFRVNRRQMSAQLAADGDSVLNIERTLSDEGFVFTVNHHFPDLNVENAKELLTGKVRAERDKAVELFKELFGYEDIGVETFPFPET